MQLIVFKAADVNVALGAVEGPVAFQLSVDKMPGELIAAGVAALAFAVGLAVGELALVGAAVVEFETTEP
ncbi:hypothetical protein D3C84_1290630 [compost metagenome]